MKANQTTGKVAPGKAATTNKKEDTTMAKTDTAVTPKAVSPAVVPNGSIKTVAAPTEAPKTRTRAPAQGKIELQFDVPIPERKSLGRPAGDGGQWGKLVDALAKSPGKAACVYTSVEKKEVYIRRNTILFAAKRKGIALDNSKLCVRDTGKMEGDKHVYGLWAAVADGKVADAQNKKIAERDAKRLEVAKAAGFSDYAAYAKDKHEKLIAARQAEKSRASA